MYTQQANALTGHYAGLVEIREIDQGLTNFLAR